MNIVYITILLLAVSDKIPSHLDFLKSKLLLVIIRRAGPSHPTEIQVKPTLTKPDLPFLFQSVAMRMRVSQNKVSFLSSLEKKKVNMYTIFSSHLANFSPKKPKKAP